MSSVWCTTPPPLSRRFNGSVGQRTYIVRGRRSPSVGLTLTGPVSVTEY